MQIDLRPALGAVMEAVICPCGKDLFNDFAATAAVACYIHACVHYQGGGFFHLEPRLFFGFYYSDLNIVKNLILFFSVVPI